jgi:hypothetical protein
LLATVLASLAPAAGSLHVVATITTPSQPIGVALGGGSVWSASFDFGGSA